MQLETPGRKESPPLGKVYLLYPKHGSAKAFDAVKALAGAHAKVTGKLTGRDGINGLEVHAAEPAE